MNVRGPKSEKWQTTCCAMGILTASEDTPLKELEYQIERARSEAKEKWNPNDRRSGETLLLCVTVPLIETGLEKKLESKGFKLLTKFNRRTGYPQTGKLKLWGLNLID